MLITSINRANRHAVNEILLDAWGELKMYTKEKVHLLDKLSGYVAIENSQIKGVITYHIDNHFYEIVSLNSFEPNRGIGSMLLQKAIETAHQNQCYKIWLVTTNDNLDALSFYQKRKFDLIDVYNNAITQLRRKKPSIPTIGNHGIPIKHEIEMARFIN